MESSGPDTARGWAALIASQPNRVAMDMMLERVPINLAPIVRTHLNILQERKRHARAEALHRADE